MDANLANVLIAVFVPTLALVFKAIQDNRIAKAQVARDVAAASKVEGVAVKVEETRKVLAANTIHVDNKLDDIHQLVNAQLTEAVNRYKEAARDAQQATAVAEVLKNLLIKLAPDDPRVKALTEETT